MNEKKEVKKENRVVLYSAVIFVLWGMLIMTVPYLTWRERMLSDNIMLQNHIEQLKIRCEELERQIEQLEGGGRNE